MKLEGEKGTSKGWREKKKDQQKLNRKKLVSKMPRKELLGCNFGAALRVTICRSWSCCCPCFVVARSTRNGWSVVQFS
jgi:hypothetical protein